MGARQGTLDWSECCLWRQDATHLRFDTRATTASVETDLSQLHTADLFSSGACYLDGIQVKDDGTQDENASYAVWLGDINDTGGGMTTTYPNTNGLRIYECQIYEGDTLVHDFIPGSTYHIKFRIGNSDSTPFTLWSWYHTYATTTMDIMNEYWLKRTPTAVGDTYASTDGTVSLIDKSTTDAMKLIFCADSSTDANSSAMSISGMNESQLESLFDFTDSVYPHGAYYYHIITLDMIGSQGFSDLITGEGSATTANSGSTISDNIVYGK
jgi:hypothetical protein